MLPRSLVRWFQRPSHSSGRQRHASLPSKTLAFRPGLEALEDRRLLSVSAVSLAASGTEMGDRPSSISYNFSGFATVHQEALSSDGQFAVFSSTSDDLVASPTTGFTGNVYRRDLVNGTTSLVSISGDGTSGVVGGSFANQPAVTPDGRYVAFVSDSPNLTSNSNGSEQVFVRDMQQGQTYLVSLGTDGNPSNTNYATEPSIAETSNGQLVIAYQSTATNLTAHDTNSSNYQIFVTTFNLDAGGNIEYNTLATQLASADGTGNGANGASDDAILTRNGSTLAFESLASNLAGATPDNADGHQHDQVFTYNIASGTLTQVNPAQPAGQTTDASWLSSISDNGRYLTFDNQNNSTGVAQVLAWDGATGTNSVIDTNTGATYPVLDATVISGDGSTIAFRAGTVYGRAVIYATSNWQTGSPTLIQVTPDPINPVFSSHNPSISDNGEVIAYQLSPTFTADQVYVWNNGTTTEISAATTGGDSNGAADTPAVSADGSTVIFNSQASNLITGVNFPSSSTENVFAFSLPGTTSVVPVVAILGAPASGPEGTAINLTSLVTESSPGDPAGGFTYSWSVTKDGAPFATGNTANFGFTPDDEGTYVVSLQVTDDEGAIGTAPPQTITGVNVPPSNLVPTLSATSITENGTVTLGGSFADPGTLDTHTVVIDWGDGSTQTSLNLAAGVLTFSGASHQYLDNPPGQPNGSYTITVTVTDDDGGVGAGSTSIQVNDVPPTAGITGPSDGVRGQERDFTLTAADGSANDRAGGYMYNINWGDGSPVQTIAATPDNGAAVGVGHVFTTDGAYTIQVTATGADDGLPSAVVSQQVTITTYAFQPDPVYPGKIMLVVGGTTGDDRIRLAEFRLPQPHVGLMLNGEHYSLAEPTSRIVVYGQSGNDFIDAGGTITPAWLFAGDGNDTLIGGAGNDVLVGGAGSNRLIATNGRNLLIGGTGTATLVGAAGDNILIAGYTDFDHNDPALAGIMAEWTSNHSYADRVANLSGVGSSNRLNGDVFLISSGPNTTVHHGNAQDTLIGGVGQNWFFADLDGLFPDNLHGRRPGEVVQEIE